MLKIALIAGALALAPTAANAAIIEFEDVVPTTFQDPVTVGDYAFDFDTTGYYIGDPNDTFYPDGVTNGTNILVASGSTNGGTVSSSVTMTRADGAAFDLFGVDLASSNSTIANSVTITGTLLGGGTVTTTLAAGTSFASYDLLGFEDVVSVVFKSALGGPYNTAGFALDNLDLVQNVSAVPLPGALPFLIAGLGGLGVARRRVSKA